jgi:diguanylate cyclase (GGDEF)-like protein
MSQAAQEQGAVDDAHVQRAYEELRQHATGLVVAWEQLNASRWNVAHGRGLLLATKQLLRSCERLRLSLARKASELETFVRVFVDTNLVPNSEQLRALSAMVSALASTVLALDLIGQGAAAASAKPASPAPAEVEPRAAAAPVPAARPPAVSVRARRRIDDQLLVLIGSTAEFGTDLAAAFAEHGYNTRCFGDAASAMAVLAEQIPRGVLMGATHANALSGMRQLLQPVERLGEEHREPVLGVLASRQDLGRRLLALRQGVKYFEPPVDPLVILVSLTSEAVQSGAAGRVLLVDGERARVQAAAAWLGDAGFEVCTCTGSHEALEQVDRFRPQIAVVDADLRGADSMRAVHGLRDHPATADVPIILLASSRELASREQAIAGGADEYLLKPMKPRHLIGVIEARLKRSRRYQPRRHGNRDEATGLYPRREFIERADAALGSAGAVVVFVALDEHETLRKRLGISGQSRVDIAVGQAFRESLRVEDLPALFQDGRYLILLRRPTRTDAMAAAEALREALLRRRMQVGEQEIALKASLGLASLEGDAADVAINNAEAAALAAMHMGGNRSMWFELSSATLMPAERDAQLRSMVVSRRFGLNLEIRGMPWLPLKGTVPGQYELQMLWRPGGPGTAAVGQSELAQAAREAGCSAEFDRFLVAETLGLRAQQLKRGRQLRLVTEVSAYCLDDGGFVAFVEGKLREQRLSGTGLALVLPPEAVPARIDALVAFCQQLKPLGIRVGLRDIGRDLTLVPRLKGLPVDFYRLAPELAGVAPQERAAEVLGSLVRRAHDAGITVVASGLDSREQSGYLQAQGVDYATSTTLAGPSAGFDFDFARWMAPVAP